MVKPGEFQANWISAPGDTMADILRERHLSLADFAKDMERTNEHAQNLLDGCVTLTIEDAQKLGNILGGSTSFWINREKQYRDDLTRLFGDGSPENGKEWLNKLPIIDMVKFGWIPPLSRSVNKVVECLRFFGVSSMEAWFENYGDVDTMAAFRTSTTFSSETGAVAAWLRQGEIECKPINCPDWNPARFKETLPKIRSLTRKSDPSLFIPLLKTLCADCGVVVLIVRAPKGCRASGATRFVSPTKAILQLSFRYLSDDHFWFTFFHEAGHLLLHSKASLFLEGTGGDTSKEEDEANAFAADMLIPAKSQAALRALGNDAKKVMRFARNIDVSSGIVVGQMQHFGLIQRHHLNKLKTRFSWETYSK